MSCAPRAARGAATHGIGYVAGCFAMAKRAACTRNPLRVAPWASKVIHQISRVTPTRRPRGAQMFGVGPYSENSPTGR